MTSPLSKDLHKRVMGAIRAVRSEEFHDGRVELYYLAHEHDHLVDILGVMVEEELAPTIREDFLLMAAKQVPWKLRELLDRDQQAAEIALKHRDFRELSGGPEALVGWVMDQPEAIRKNHIELLARSAIEEAMAQPETEPHLLRLLAEQNVLGSVNFDRPLFASKHHALQAALVERALEEGGNATLRVKRDSLVKTAIVNQSWKTVDVLVAALGTLPEKDLVEAVEELAGIEMSQVGVHLDSQEDHDHLMRILGEHLPMDFDFGRVIEIDNYDIFGGQDNIEKVRIDTLLGEGFQIVESGIRYRKLMAQHAGRVADTGRAAPKM